MIQNISKNPKYWHHNIVFKMLVTVVTVVTVNSGNFYSGTRIASSLISFFWISSL